MPLPQERELSLFGPGVGECIIIHLGNGAWIVIDSCRLGAQPVSVQYLDALGVPRDRVAAVIVTHWHDDHTKGIAQAFEAFPAAKFYCSSAIGSREFISLVATANERFDRDSGLSELSALLESILDRSGPRRRKGVGPVWLQNGQRFLTIPGQDGEIETEVWALSPSAASITKSLHQIGEMLPEYRQAKRRIVERANQLSVALLVKTGGRAVLLGSDLEEDGDPACGWSAVVANHTNVGGKGDLYKVAHHGSRTGHLDTIYSHLLGSSPIALLTPFRRSRLPGPEDIERIRTKCAAVHLSAPVAGRPRPARNPTVEKALREITKNRWIEDTDMGLIRARWSLGSEIAIEHFGSAHLAA